MACINNRSVVVRVWMTCIILVCVLAWMACTKNIQVYLRIWVYYYDLNYHGSILCQYTNTTILWPVAFFEDEEAKVHRVICGKRPATQQSYTGLDIDMYDNDSLWTALMCCDHMRTEPLAVSAALQRLSLCHNWKHNADVFDHWWLMALIAIKEKSSDTFIKTNCQCLCVNKMVFHKAVP